MNNKWRKIAALFLAVAFIVTLSGCGAPTIGVVDMNKIMTDAPKVKSFQDQLNAKGKELSDQLDKDKASMSAEDFAKKQEAVYGDFLKFRQDLESQVDDSVKNAVQQVATEKKLSAVLYKNMVAYGGTDVTDAVIQKMQ